jgi:hypothetical protein
MKPKRLVADVPAGAMVAAAGPRGSQRSHRGHDARVRLLPAATRSPRS